MTILIVAENYLQFKIFQREWFPYFKEHEISYINPKETEKAMGLERGTIYFNPYDCELPLWFTARFNKVKMAKAIATTQSFGKLG